MNIFLIGFMGSGKSTLGDKLANIIDYNFVDFDQLIENQLDLSIDEIFSIKGESYFRDVESELLNNLNVNNTVIALGGGTPCYNNNLPVINQKGLSIYLQIPTKTLVNRLIDSKTIRPLIEICKNDPILLQEKIDDLLIEREPFYLSADIVFNAENMTDKKYDDLLEQIERYFLSF
jgi:shikimate kinase